MLVLSSSLTVLILRYELNADLNARPVGQLVQGLFERLDKTRFEIFAFSLEVYDGSEPARRMMEAATDFQFVKVVIP